MKLRNVIFQIFARILNWSFDKSYRCCHATVIVGLFVVKKITMLTSEISRLSIHVLIVVLTFYAYKWSSCFARRLFTDVFRLLQQRWIYLKAIIGRKTQLQLTTRRRGGEKSCNWRRIPMEGEAQLSQRDPAALDVIWKFFNRSRAILHHMTGDEYSFGNCSPGLHMTVSQVDVDNNYFDP